MLRCLMTALGCLIFTATSSTAEDQARYRLTVEITWSEETAPFEFPGAPHMSGLIGITHNSRYALFRDGDHASSGLELVAENGRPSIIKAEFAEGQRRKRVGEVFQAPGLSDLPDAFEVEFTASVDHPRVSFVTMLAPSPDWFTGHSDLLLLRDEVWVEDVKLPVWVWDSGTDLGETFRAPNEDNQPQQSIRLLATPHFLTDKGLVPIGQATLKRIR